jgi:uncharacterized protein YjaG (DUF416 family)
VNLVDEYNKIFTHKLSAVVKDRQDAYDNLKAKKSEAEELVKEIKIFSAISKCVDAEIELSRSLKASLTTAQQEVACRT